MAFGVGWGLDLSHPVPGCPRLGGETSTGGAVGEEGTACIRHPFKPSEFALLGASVVQAGSAGRYSGWVRSHGAWLGCRSPPGPIPAGKQGAAPRLHGGARPSSSQAPIFFFITFIFIIPCLKSFSLIKEDSASRVPGLA